MRVEIQYLCEAEVEGEVCGADVVLWAEDVLRVGVAATLELGRQHRAPGEQVASPPCSIDFRLTKLEFVGGIAFNVSIMILR